jgi:hypothetical protein
MHVAPIIVGAGITPHQLSHHEVVTISITYPMHGIETRGAGKMAEQLVLLRIIENAMPTI